MRLLASLLITACATARPLAAEPRDTAESTPALPALRCPEGTRAVEMTIAEKPLDYIDIRAIGSCCVGGCEPRRDPTWYAATLCGQQFTGLHVVRAVACRSSDGVVNGPFVVLANQARVDGACRGNVLDGPWAWRRDWRSTQPIVREEGAFAGGQRDGLWTIGSDDGVVASRGHFVAGARVGTWTTNVLTDGAVIERRTEHHGDDGLLVSESRDRTGALRSRAITRRGQLDGLQEWTTDGVRSTRTYAAGRMIARDEWNAGTHRLCTTSTAGDERCQYWDARGALRFEGTRAAGADHAQWTAWYPTGERLGTSSSLGSVIDSSWARSDGQQRLWYRDGTPLADHTCVNGDARGRERVWYPNGNLRFDDRAGPPYRTSDVQAFEPDGTPSDTTRSCSDHVMSCQFRGSSHKCMALWTFVFVAEPYRDW